MVPFWIVKFNGSGVCIEAESQDAAEKIAAAHFIKIKEIHRIPYPTHPQIGERSGCPQFCTGGSTCWGQTACPSLSRACND